MSTDEFVTIEIPHPDPDWLKTSGSKHDDRVSLDLVSRKREVLMKCPVCQALLDARVPIVECLVDETMYCRSCTIELAKEDQRCWICGIFLFSDMLQLSK